ncbi:hypothetical protein C4D60_Mb10t27860 [Musa balbisiana]|uniref:Serine-threonine/tyrosine-protein kinase catalytic domain-containing protein n=1 Tax=Musa balbisiana TaxID=52838 RepID=A0A4S8J0E2_MUSBA|nr:hypothetical protein C4D60_Mb10t27860 [Musa balbisiana]
MGSGCFACTGPKVEEKDRIQQAIDTLKCTASWDVKNHSPWTEGETSSSGSRPIAAHVFSYRELAAATKFFRADFLLGEGGFGRVYKGMLESGNQARPMLNDRMKFQQIADPVFQGQYPPRGLYQALAVAAMCVQEQPSMRPLMGDVVTALSYLSSQPNKPENQQRPNTYRLTATSTPRRICQYFTEI